MGVPASPDPHRAPAGVSTGQKYSYDADMGIINPAFYEVDFYDFNKNELGTTGPWTKSATTTGTTVERAGDGGRSLFSTAAANNDAVSIQRPFAAFTLPQGVLAGKKMFFHAHLQLGDVVASAFIAGMCNITATPFTAVADGVYFQKSSASGQINIISVVGSVATTTPIPVVEYSLVNATDIDLAWYINRSGELLVSVAPNVVGGPGLVGYMPQSGTGGTAPDRCPDVRVTGLTLTTVNLSPTLGVQAGAAAIKTMDVDFFLAAKER